MHTTLAASYPANAFGLHDMHGNLWEWCQDEYDAGAYRKTAKENPVVRGDGESRVMRGGSWVTKADALRSANRSHAWPDMATAFYGLRLVRDARPAEPMPEAETP
jgi:formylglycine-generating enzyme required for sulfatase activity